VCLRVVFVGICGGIFPLSTPTQPQWSRGGVLSYINTYGVAVTCRLLKSHISFAKETYKTDDILQKRFIILRSLHIVASSHVHRVVFVVCMCVCECASSLNLLDGYCSTVQGLLDWFQVDLGCTKLLFIQIDLCVLCIFVFYSLSFSSCPFLDILHCFPRAVGMPLESLESFPKETYKRDDILQKRFMGMPLESTLNLWACICLDPHIDFLKGP